MLTLMFFKKPDSNRPFQFYFLILFITLFLRELGHKSVYNLCIFSDLCRNGSA